MRSHHVFWILNSRDINFIRSYACVKCHIFVNSGDKYTRLRHAFIGCLTFANIGDNSFQIVLNDTRVDPKWEGFTIVNIVRIVSV